MLSNFTLKIKGQELADEYLIKRNKEIIPMSAGVATLLIVANIIVAIISIVSNWNEYILELWLGRIIGIVLNVVLVIVGYKYPKQTAPYHGAFLVLN